MYYNGELRSPGLELMLILVRILAILAVLIIGAGAGMVAGLPPIVSGVLSGIFTFYFFIRGPLFEVINYKCPGCGNSIRTLSEFGSYNCSNCGTSSVINN